MSITSSGRHKSRHSTRSMTRRSTQRTSSKLKRSWRRRLGRNLTRRRRSCWTQQRSRQRMPWKAPRSMLRSPESMHVLRSTRRWQRILWATTFGMAESSPCNPQICHPDLICRFPIADCQTKAGMFCEPYSANKGYGTGVVVAGAKNAYTPQAMTPQERAIFS